MYKCAFLKLLANVALLTLLFSQSETNTVISNSFLTVRLSNMGSRDASTWLQCVGPTLHCWGAWVILEWQMSFLKISCRMGMVQCTIGTWASDEVFQSENLFQGGVGGVSSNFSWDGGVSTGMCEFTVFNCSLVTVQKAVLILRCANFSGCDGDGGAEFNGRNLDLSQTMPVQTQTQHSAIGKRCKKAMI